MYKIAVENLPALFRKIAADQELYLPVKVSEQVNFNILERKKRKFFKRRKKL